VGFEFCPDLFESLLVYMYIRTYLYLFLTAVGLAAVQYTFTHKRYTDYRERNTHNSQKKIDWEARSVPCLCELYPGSCVTTEEKTRKILS
jgi:hypothetical protein